MILCYDQYFPATSIDWGIFVSATWGRFKQQTPDIPRMRKYSWDPSLQPEPFCLNKKARRRENTCRSRRFSIQLLYVLSGAFLIRRSSSWSHRRDIRACNLLFFRRASPTSLPGFFYIFKPGFLLRLCWLFILRNIGTVFRLKYISLNMFGL